MKSNVKVFAVLAVIFMLLSAVPVTICDYSAGDVSGDALPSSYDLRNTYKNVTPVRDQGSEGLCWAFATAAALEGELINMGYGDTSTILSPLYEAVRQYDSNTYSGKGDSIVLWNGDLNKEGGHPWQYGLILSDGKGPMYEYIAPYEETVTAYKIDKTIYDSSVVLVKQADVYDTVEDADEIKRMLMQGHVGIFGFKSGQKSEVAVYSTPLESEGSDHAVALIGWDDNYSKDNFKTEQPEGNGAWIIKNSWGEDAGDKGYNYVSYYQEIQSVVFLSNVVVNDGSEFLYSYDHGYSFQHDLVYRGSATMANVFTSERDETLTGTSFSIYEKKDLDQDYSVYVYKLNNDYTYASQGELMALSKSAGAVDHNGTYYVEFDQPVLLKKGDKFSICVEFTGDTVDIPIDTTEDFYYIYTSYAVASPGQSYVCYDGKWTDISADGKSNVRIKAHTSTDITYEASVNGVIYERFSDALVAAKSGETVKLLGDITLDQIELRKDINLNLCGHTITFNITDPSKPAISINDSAVVISYGKLVSSEGRMIEQTGGTLYIDHIKIDMNGNELPLVTDGTKVTVKGMTYSGGDGFRFTGGSAEIISSYITCTGYIVDSDGCDVSIRGGIYRDSNDNALTGTVCVYTGEFHGFDPKGKMNKGSFIEPIGKSPLDGYKVFLDEVSSDSGEKRLEDAAESGGNIKLLRDMRLEDMLTLGADMTLDLNGHTLTVTNEPLFMLMNYKVSVINTSSETAAIVCPVLFFASDKSTGYLTIGDNIKVTVTKSCCSQNSDTKCTFSDKSTVQKVESDGNSKQVFRYITEGGVLKTILTITNTDDFRNPTGSYSGTVMETTGGYEVTDGKAYDASGKLIGGWNRTSVKTGFSTLTIVDKVTDAGGRTTIEISKSCNYSGDRVNVSAHATAGETATVKAFVYGKSHTLSVDPKLIENGKKDLDAVLTTELSGYEFVSVDKTISIVCIHSENKLLEADVINGYLRTGYNIGVEMYRQNFILKAGTGELSGDTVIKIGKIDPDELNEAQDKAITTGVVFEIIVTVDSENVSELPCDCTVSFSDTVTEGSRFYTFDEKGVLTELRSAYRESDRSYTVDLGKETVFVMDPVGYSEPSMVDENTVIVVTAVIAAIVVLGTGIVVLRRRL